MADWGVPAAPGVEAEAGCMTGGSGSGFPEANSAKSGIYRKGERTLVSLLAGAIGGFLCDVWGIFAEG